MAEEDAWPPARLIPTSGIKGQAERERRATSCLLAVMGAVPDFGHALLGPLGAPRGRIVTYAEVPFTGAGETACRPDGVIVVERGKTRWVCLLEVKTDGAPLEQKQVSQYLDIAREQEFDVVATLSNDITESPRVSPLTVDRRKLKKVDLRHLSWWRVLTEAIVAHQHRGVADREQAWILGELIAYLDHESSGASGFQDMGPHWVKVREGARRETLRSNDIEVRSVIERWEQFVDYLCLGLSQDLGRDVRPVRPRKQTREARLGSLAEKLASEGRLDGGLRVPDSIGSIDLMVDLRARQVTTSVSVSAPQKGRPKTSITWLLKQLREAPPELRIDASFANVRGTTSALLADVLGAPERLLSTDPKRAPRSFELALTRPLATKRGRADDSFVQATRRQAVDFYRDLVQDLRAWQAAAPKLPEQAAGSPVPDPTPDPEAPDGQSET